MEEKNVIDKRRQCMKVFNLHEIVMEGLSEKVTFQLGVKWSRIYYYICDIYINISFIYCLYM